MHSQSDEPAKQSTASRLTALGVSLARLVWGWVTALYLVAWMELDWRGGIREILAHIRAHPQLAVSVGLAALAGWFAASSTSQASSNWMYRHQLLTQVIIGGALILMVGTMIFASVAGVGAR